MRRVILFSLVALAALGAGAYAFAGSPSQGQTAFALVNPNGGSPLLVGAHTNGFVAVSSPSTGDYCLTPGAGVDVVHTAAVADQEAFYSDTLGIALVRYQPNGPNCSANQLEVKTFDLTPSLSNQVAFTVNVP
jgi:hypothetical protein